MQHTINELEEIFTLKGNVTVRAYYKIIELNKVYYDYQSLNKEILVGKYEEIRVLDLIYFLNTQKN